MGIFDWSKTPGSNTSLEGIGWAEGMSPSNVNNGVRAIAAALKEWQEDTGGANETTGSSNTYALATDSDLSSIDYETGQWLVFKANHSNTGAATLNVDSLGAKALRKFSSGAEAALDSGDIVDGGFYIVHYDAAANSAAGAWIVINPTYTTVTELSADTTPQLGGDLDPNSNGVSAAWNPASNDGAALGTASLGWSDLHLASGAVVNFANGNFTITHSSGVLTVSGQISMADQVLSRPKLIDYGETVNAIGSIGGGTQDIDIALGNVVTGTVDTSETTFTFSNPSASGTCCSFTLILTNGGSQTVNWPASVDWVGGNAPTLTSSGVDVLTFFTVNAGTTWYGFVAGLGMS